MWKDAEEFLIKDRYIGPLVKRCGSCKINPKVKSDYFQELTRDIIGQQLSGRVADIIYDRLKTKIIGWLTHTRILALSNQELRVCGMAWSKVISIKDLAQKVNDKKLHIGKLNELSDDDVVAELIAIKGIGRWTAEMFLMFTLGRPDIFPLDDLGIKKGFEKVTSRKWDKVKASKFAEIHWKPYRTVASWYIWRSLEK